jgi:hypothetical protein
MLPSDARVPSQHARTKLLSAGPSSEKEGIAQGNSSRWISVCLMPGRGRRVPGLLIQGGHTSRRPGSAALDWGREIVLVRESAAADGPELSPSVKAGLARAGRLIASPVRDLGARRLHAKLAAASSVSANLFSLFGRRPREAIRRESQSRTGWLSEALPPPRSNHFLQPAPQPRRSGRGMCVFRPPPGS